jgi:hypothetical protein
MAEKDRSERDETEKPRGPIEDDAPVTGAEAQETAGTVEGQVPGTQSTVQTSQTDEEQESSH